MYVLFLVFVLGLVIALQNIAIGVLSKILQESYHLAMFLPTLIYAVYVPISFFILAKYVEGFLAKFLVILISLILNCMNVTTFIHLAKSYRARESPSPNGSKFASVLIVSSILTIAWIVVLIFFTG